MDKRIHSPQPFWERRRTYVEVNETSDSYEEVAITNIRGKQLCITAKMSQNNLFATLIASITEQNRETKERELTYYYKKQFVGLGEKDLTEKILNVARYKSVEMEMIAKEEI